jgi:hypothetical protein
MYSEYATDAKVQSMTEPMQRRLVMLFCLRCCDVTVTLSDEELAFQLRISDEDLEETKALFIKKGFINEDWDLVNWDRRQFSSDSSAERTREYRERKKLEKQNGKKEVVTSQKRHSDALDTDTESDKKQNIKTIVSPSGETHEVFDYWKTFHNHPQAKLDDKRSRAIKARLKDGYSVGELCKAIEGCKYSEYHQGKNDSGTVYDDIELICRNATNVDKFIVLAGKGPPNGASQDMNQTLSMLQQWVLEEENGKS